MGFLSILFGLLMMILFIPFIGLVVVYFIGLWKLFKKCGYVGWEALVPLYNSWILIKISGLNSWYYVMLMGNIILGVLSFGSLVWLGQIASLVANFFMYYNICKKFHKDMFFVVLTFLFPLVMIPILGMKRDNIYDDSVCVSPNGPIGDTDFNANSYNQTNNNNFYCRYCGTRLNNNSKYCSNCGNKVNENE